jgi:hypothetical protein
VLSTAALLTGVVAAFSQLWTRGALVIDGPGNALYLRLASSYIGAIGRVPYWLPEMFAGAPPWALAPSFPAMLLVPLTSLTGADVATKVAILFFQVLGGVGTYVLARSLWGRTSAATVAAVVYTLHPLLIAHGALAGSEPAAGVVAAVPWLVWSLRRGLRGDGPGYLVVAGLVAAFAVLHQAELAYALVLLCALLMFGELRRSYAGQSPTSGRQLLRRATVVVGVAVGIVAHWLAPFLALGKWFVLTPPELVRGELYFDGSAAQVSREIGVFLHRSGGLHGTMSFQTPGLLPEFFYLGWVCVVLTLLTLLLVARREGEPALATVILVGLFGVWMSTGSVPLAASGPALRHEWPALAAVGLAVGLAVGGYLRRMQLGRAHTPFLVGAIAVVACFPFVAPFVGLQSVVPLLASLRFPRFYVVAPLGLALGTAYPVTYLSRWAATHRPSSRRVWASAASVAVLAAFAVDISPYASFYRVHPPPSNGAFDRMNAELAKSAGDGRVNPSYIDPRVVTKLLASGRQSSMGWPHPVAGIHLWRLTGEAYVAPYGYREAAFGLSSTAFLAVEHTKDTGTPDESVEEIQLVPNPRTLPLVRTYDQVVVIEDPGLSPLVATALAARNVGVVTGDESVAGRFAGMPVASVPTASPCQAGIFPDLGPLAGEVATACGLDPWIGAFFAGATVRPLKIQDLGAVHQSLTNGLRGMAVWLDGPADRVELTLYELSDDGRTLGAELARSQAVGTDENGLTAFTFDVIRESAGRRYGFVLRCSACAPGLRTNAVTGRIRDGEVGNLIIGDSLYRDQQLAFVPIYDRLPPASPPGTRATAERRGPGKWRIETDGGLPSLLVVAETYFPGWHAVVDGKSVPVMEADGAFVGVALPPGKHVVSLEYRRPAAAIVGRVITFSTLGGILVWALRRRRRTVRGSGATSDALQMRTPAAPPDWESTLDPEQRRPRPSIADRQSPGEERDEAVLADVDHLEPRIRQQRQQGRRPEP